jgi:tetratricopeptide (TPR) repeat protein
MSKRKMTIMVLATLAIVAFSRLGALYKSAGAEEAILTDVADINPSDLGDFPPVADGIQVFQDRVRRNPRDAISLTILGQLYLQQARETGDVAGYTRAEAALRKALELLPDYPSATTTLASVLYAQHNFVEALDLAQQIYQGDSRRTEALATMGDAYLALGRYQEAEEAYQELVRRGATPPVLARIAHQAELKGAPEEALQLMQRAARDALAASQSREDVAWYLIRLGDLYFNVGQVEEAGKHYEAALRIFENYTIALAGVGKVRAAQGRYDEAIEFYEQAVAIIPQPDILAALGDVYAVAGRPDEAQHRYDTVEYIGKLAKINQQVYNRQLANFYTDHDLHVDEALRLATAELNYRQDIYGFDAVAWAYYKNGMLDEAQAMIEQAIRLGTRDAKLYYHAGMIAHARGHTAEAKHLLSQALMINPHFDLSQSRIARATLESLGGEQKPGFWRNLVSRASLADF